MEQLDLFEQIKKLCNDYYEQRISFEEYRKMRNVLLKKIDSGYNGVE